MFFEFLRFGRFFLFFKKKWFLGPNKNPPCVTCHLSIAPTAKATDLPPANAPTMHRRLVCKDPKNVSTKKVVKPSVKEKYPAHGRNQISQRVRILAPIPNWTEIDRKGYFMCHVSCFICHASYVTCNVSRVTCLVSCVVSPVTYHLPPATLISKCKKSLKTMAWGVPILALGSSTKSLQSTRMRSFQ